MKVRILSVAAAAWLAATPVPAANPPSPQASSPDEAPGVPWILFPGEDGVMISQSDTHGRATILLCAPGSGRIVLTHDLFTPDMPTVTLSAGDLAETYPLAPEGPDDGAGTRRFTIATVPGGSPVLAVFRTSGRMVLAAGDERIPVITTRETAPVVERFLTSCG